jgi:hypothetical protein
MMMDARRAVSVCYAAVRGCFFPHHRIFQRLSSTSGPLPSLRRPFRPTTVVSSIPSGAPCAYQAAFALLLCTAISNAKCHLRNRLSTLRGTLALIRPHYCTVLSSVSAWNPQHLDSSKASESGLATSREIYELLRRVSIVIDDLPRGLGLFLFISIVVFLVFAEKGCRDDDAHAGLSECSLD